MGKYIPQYVCRMCGQVIRTGNPTEVPPDKIPFVLAQVVKQQQLLGTIHYTAPMQIPHKCPDGSGGLAYFCGLKKLD